jgi:hypothetical protein
MHWIRYSNHGGEPKTTQFMVERKLQNADKDRSKLSFWSYLSIVRDPYRTSEKKQIEYDYFNKVRKQVLKSLKQEKEQCQAGHLKDKLSWKGIRRITESSRTKRKMINSAVWKAKHLAESRFSGTYLSDFNFQLSFKNDGPTQTLSEISNTAQ